MKAIYLENPNNIFIKEIEKPKNKAGHALIKVRSASICGSDVGAFRGANPLVSYPRIIGHEVAGEIIEVSENEKNLKIGDKVILDPYSYCGSCYPCSIGRTNCCENLQVLGVHVDGGMTEFFSSPISLIHKLPDDIKWDEAPLAEPLTIALHSLHRGNVSEGEYVVIIGAGPIGLLAALTAIHYKAIPILIDILDNRLSYAKTLGINNTINPTKSNATEIIKKITNNSMAQLVIEASGSNVAIKNSFEYASFAGRIVFTGWPKNFTELDTATITKKELDIRGSRTSAGEFQEAIDLIYNKKINIRSIISKVVSFDELPSSVSLLSEQPENFLKIIGLM